jgi:predicted TIM-barrel fold metal-dependent hydrolase
MSVATAAPKTKLKIIDADTHFTEPHDLWLKRAPASLKDRVPQVKVLNGEPAWVIDGDKMLGFKAHPNSAILKNGRKIRTIDEFLKVTFDDVHEGSWHVKTRLNVMDDVGVYAQIMYPNILGFGGQNSSKVDFDLRLATVQMFNDAMAEVQSDSGGRLYPMALVPWWDVQDAARETERAAKLGLRGININSDPHTQLQKSGEKIPDLATEYWYPLWEVCQDLDTPINFHIGASEQADAWLGEQGWPSLPRDLQAGLGGAMLFFNNGRVMSNIIYSRALDRYPKLKFVSVESGVGWIPFLLEALDYQLAEIAEGRKFDLAPSEYFRRNFYGCFWFEKKHIAETLRQVGIDNVMFETDFPHPTSLHPIDNLEQRLASLTEEERAKVMSLNAAKLYRIAV